MARCRNCIFARVRVQGFIMISAQINRVRVVVDTFLMDYGNGTRVNTEAKYVSAFNESVK